MCLCAWCVDGVSLVTIACNTATLVHELIPSVKHAILFVPSYTAPPTAARQSETVTVSVCGVGAPVSAAAVAPTSVADYVIHEVDGNGFGHNVFTICFVFFH